VIPAAPAAKITSSAQVLTINSQPTATPNPEASASATTVPAAAATAQKSTISTPKTPAHKVC